MKSHGIGEIEIIKINAPVGWPDGEPDWDGYQGLRKSLEELGLLQPIGVSTEDEILWGRKRLLAAKELGWTTIRAHVLDVEPGEAAIITLAENVYRRDLTEMEREQALADLAAFYEREEKPVPRSQVSAPSPQDDSDQVKRNTGGRGKKGAARKAAEAADVDPSAVRRARSNVGQLTPEDQAALKAAKATRKQIGEAATLSGLARAKFLADLTDKARRKKDPTAPVLDAEGWELPPTVAEHVTLINARLSVIHQKLKDAQSEWTRLKTELTEKLNGRMPEILAVLSPLDARMGKEVHQTCHLVGAVMPHALCPDCKGTKYQASCTGCRGQGWVGKSAYDRAEEVLRVKGKNAGIWVRDNGGKPEFVKLSELP